MFKMCTLKWSKQRSAEHNGTTTKPANISSTTEKQGSSGTEGRIYGSGRDGCHGCAEEEDAHTCDFSSVIVHHMHGRRWSSRGSTHARSHNTLHNVLVLISIQTSSLITIMTFSSSAIDPGLKHGAQLQHCCSQAEENATH